MEKKLMLISLKKLEKEEQTISQSNWEEKNNKKQKRYK